MMILLTPITVGLSFIPGLIFALLHVNKKPHAFLGWAALIFQLIPFSFFCFVMLMWGPTNAPPAPLDKWRHRFVIGGLWTYYAPNYLEHVHTDSNVLDDDESYLRYRSFGRDTFSIDRVSEFAQTQNMGIFRQDFVTEEQAARLNTTMIGHAPERNKENLEADLVAMQKLMYPLTRSAHRMIQLVYETGGDVHYLVLEPEDLGDGKRRETFIAVRNDGRRMVIYQAIRTFDDEFTTTE